MWVQVPPLGPLNMNKKFVYYKREFLNKPPHSGTASLLFSIFAEPEFRGMSPNVCFQISDCHRQISLDLHVFESEDYENNIHKLDLLLQSIQEFKNAYVEHIGSKIELMKEKEEKKKLKEKKEKENVNLSSSDDPNDVWYFKLSDDD